jgi:hypothetical protein
MSDLIKRLRRAAGLYDYEERPIINEAADLIEELEARLDQQKDEYEGLIDVAEANYKKLENQLNAEERLDAVRDAPVTIKINADGQAWIVFNAGSGAHAMVNLNNIVSEMPQVGINRGICIDALSAALQGE